MCGCGDPQLLLALLHAGAPFPPEEEDPRLADHGGQWGFHSSSCYRRGGAEGEESFLPQLVADLERFLEDISAWSPEHGPAELHADLAEAASALEKLEAGYKESVDIEEECNQEDAEFAFRDAKSDILRRMERTRGDLQFWNRESAANQLLLLLKRIMAGFQVKDLTAFPVPDKLVARALSRWECEERRLPPRALQGVLSFLPLWASAWSRPDHTRDLTLGFVDVHACGAGVPLRVTDVKHHRYTQMLSEWWHGKYDEADE